tara:strand:+ start:200 stop:610 length:411 start_codon:yes stop_codon:yes gene_type:complete
MIKKRKRANKPPNRKLTTSMYELIGGEKTVNKAVDMLYDKGVADPRISAIITNLDTKSKTIRQRLFWNKVFKDIDGTIDVSAELRQAHAHLTLTDEHFDIVITHLTEAFDELRVPIELSAPIMGRIVQLRDAVLNR